MLFFRRPLVQSVISTLKEVNPDSDVDLLVARAHVIISSLVATYTSFPIAHLVAANKPWATLSSSSFIYEIGDNDVQVVLNTPDSVGKK